MKKIILYLTIIPLIMISCQQHDCHNGIQDGGETDIDCGGDCPPCNTGGSVQSYSVQDFEGLWYQKARNTSMGMSWYTCHFPIHILEIKDPNNPLNSGCKVDYKSEMVSESMYKSLGMTSMCFYPNDSYWIFNQSENTIDGGNIWSLTSNELILSNPNQFDMFHLSRAPIDITDYNVVNWKVELIENYDINYVYDTARIVIKYRYNDVLMTETVDLTPNNNLYQGTVSITPYNDSSPCNGEFFLSINSSPNNTDYVVFRTTLEINDIISKTPIKTQYLNSQLPNSGHMILLN